MAFNGQIYGTLSNAGNLSALPGSDDSAFLHKMFRTVSSFDEFLAVSRSLIGEFAICMALPDGRVWLAKDSFGTKPLAFGFDRAGGPLVASYGELLKNATASGFVEEVGPAEALELSRYGVR